MKRSVTVGLSEFAFNALAGGEPMGSRHVAAKLRQAIRCYLNDKGSGQPGWKYPAFLRDGEVGEQVELELSIDEDLWRSFEAEAGSQGVSVQQMAAHAALYFAAEVDAGRVTERILDGLAEGES